MRRACVEIVLIVGRDEDGCCGLEADCAWLAVFVCYSSEKVSVFKGRLHWTLLPERSVVTIQTREWKWDGLHVLFGDMAMALSIREYLVGSWSSNLWWRDQIRLQHFILPCEHSSHIDFCYTITDKLCIRSIELC